MFKTASRTFLVLFLLLCRNSPNREQDASVFRLRDYTQLDAHPVGLLWTSDQPVAEAVDYSTNTIDEHRMPAAGFEPATLAN